MYDFTIVGAGLSGSTLAYLLNKDGYKVQVIDKRNHIAGNCYTEFKDNIYIHKYGPHIFHTDNEEVWNFVNQFAEFNNFINEPLAIAPDGNIYNLPFNMNTFSKIFNVNTPEEVKNIINEEISIYIVNHPNIENLEDQAIRMVGETVYRLLVKGYTEKQWGTVCSHLSPDIIKRLPLRYTFNNNYFNDRYQGIPKEGYTKMIYNMLKDIDIKLEYDFKEHKDEILENSKYIIYTGKIDEFFDYKYNNLEYRGLKFETKKLNKFNYQGNAVINNTDVNVPYTRVIEHKHFNNDESDVTYITYEYPKESYRDDIPFYPISNVKNKTLYNKYLDLAKDTPNVIFAGRLGKYSYFDMDDVILDCFKLYDELKHNINRGE